MKFARLLRITAEDLPELQVGIYANLPTSGRMGNADSDSAQ